MLHQMPAEVRKEEGKEEEMNTAYILLAIQFILNIVIILAVMLFAYKIIKEVIKKAMKEALQEYDHSSKMRSLEDNALKRVAESQRRFQ